MEARGSSKSQTEPKKRQSKMPRKPKDSVLEQKSPAEFFAENKNIAGFDNVCEGLLITVDEKVAVSEMTVSNQDVKKKVPFSYFCFQILLLFYFVDKKKDLSANRMVSFIHKIFTTKEKEGSVSSDFSGGRKACWSRGRGLRGLRRL
ncbi:uncharacterized protein [Malus domestica]|uniref:uncharacterized protein n=1 Tax=Malus domestica TaxID=3750 RepID=UPI003975D515